MFERDKEALRELGIPVETVQLDAFHEDEWAYRIDPRAYELPPVSFTRDELVAIGLAARAWRQAALEGDAATALLKIEGVGVDVPHDVSTLLEPRLSAAEPHVGALLQAAVERRPVTFTYRKRGDDPQVRHVQPWARVIRLGHSYLVGYDTDRDDSRVFRVSRIESDVSAGKPDSYTIPEGIDARALVGPGDLDDSPGVARLKVVPGRAMALRQRATADADATEISVNYASLDRFERELARYGADVTVIEPIELRQAVVARLNGVLT
jgi:proteasome accessory factor B